MSMKTIHSEYKLCTCCMQKHEVKKVQIEDYTEFKNVPINFKATYFFCDQAEEFYADEVMMRENDIAVKDAYRKSQGLLTSKSIVAIRQKYGVTQSDLCRLLGWGGKTITRYESHQVQDRAHDSILKKLDNDPEWFLELLDNSQRTLIPEVYAKYFATATMLYESSKDAYLQKSIEAEYIKFLDKPLLCGNKELSLNKVVDVIRYFASGHVENLYKVKLMKLLWYADTLAYKRNGHAITGLVYQALPMGAVPIGHASIIDLQGVPCEEIDMGDGTAYYFQLKETAEFHGLEKEEISVLDTVVEKFSVMSKKEIVDFMHRESAYKNTPPKEIISFAYAAELQL